jgi:hypothetical protein
VSTLHHRFWPLLCACSWLLACGGSSSYNYARTYEPLRAERSHYQAAQQVPYEDVKRDPNGYKEAEIAWFGVVKSIGDLPDGKSRLLLSLHAHQDRHLCAEQSESSCRVTIAERDLGTFGADLALTPEEKAGPERVWVGSLVKIYGHATGEYDGDGGPILQVTYHRHWPRGTYVTTAQRSGMRR